MTNDLALEYDPLDDDVQSDPYPYYAVLREDAPVYWLEARVALEELLAQTAVLEPAGDTERVASIVFRGPTKLPLRFR